jgi:hypothetical protein
MVRRCNLFKLYCHYVYYTNSCVRKALIYKNSRHFILSALNVSVLHKMKYLPLKLSCDNELEHVGLRIIVIFRFLNLDGIVNKPIKFQGSVTKLNMRT